MPARVESLVYDAAGRQVASRIGTEGWSCVTYDARGRPVSKTTPASAAEPAGRTVAHDYAVGGCPATISVSDPAGTITVTVDWLGPVTSYTDASTKTTATGNDQAGRVTRTAGPAGTMAASYDAASGVLSGVAYPAEVGKAGTAGHNTNRTSTSDNGGAPTTYCYDGADRLTSTTDARYGAIAYDAHGNTTTIGDQSLVYDGADRHLRTTAGTTNVAYARHATDRITKREPPPATATRATATRPTSPWTPTAP